MKLFDYHRLRQQEKEGQTPAADEWLRERVDSLLALESPDDTQLLQLCELYRAASPKQRLFMRMRVDTRRGQKLRAFSARTARRAMRTPSPDLLLDCVTANAIDNLASGDARDTLIIVALVFHIAERIGLDAERLFQQGAALAGPAMSALLLDYAVRPPGLRRVEAMGWREV